MVVFEKKITASTHKPVDQYYSFQYFFNENEYIPPNYSPHNPRCSSGQRSINSPVSHHA